MADDSEIKSAVARYLADMIGQLETMAREAKLQLPAYYLAMARTEAELITFEDRKAARNRSDARAKDTLQRDTDLIHGKLYVN